MLNTNPCERITTGHGGVPVVSLRRACLIQDNINVYHTSTQMPSPTPEGGKCIRPPYKQISYAYPMRECQSGPTDHHHFHLPLNKVTLTTQEWVARSHWCHHQKM